LRWAFSLVRTRRNKKAKIGGCKCTICAVRPPARPAHQTHLLANPLSANPLSTAVVALQTDLWWVCRQVKYDTSITALSEPIDIFCEWIDECEKANDPKSAPAPPPPRRSGGLTADSDDDDD